MKRKFLASPYIVWMAIFIIVPMVMILFYAFTEDGAFSVDNIVKAFGAVPMAALWRSLSMALISTAICLLVGYPAALFLSDKSLKKKELLLLLYMVPMWMNFLLRTYAWSIILERTGIINTFLVSAGIGEAKLLYTDGAVILGMVYNFLPFMILPIQSVLSKMDYTLTEAAEDLGANRFEVFSRVTLPLSVPGIVSGITMVFMPAVSTFVISQLMGSNTEQLFGEMVENQFRTLYNYNYGSSLSLVLLCLMLICMTLMNRLDKNKEGASLW